MILGLYPCQTPPQQYVSKYPTSLLYGQNSMILSPREVLKYSYSCRSVEDPSNIAITYLKFPQHSLLSIHNTFHIVSVKLHPQRPKYIMDRKQKSYLSAMALTRSGFKRRSTNSSNFFTFSSLYLSIMTHNSCTNHETIPQ